jgi:hypothetical protein
MAQTKKEEQRSSKKINKLMDSLQSFMDRISSNTYFTSTPNSRDLNNIVGKIDDSLSTILNNSMNNTGVPNISRLYSRINTVTGDSETKRKIEELFEDKSLMDGLLSSYTENKYLTDLDQEIDTVCKYMPKLLEALSTKKDNVLSSDHFSNDYINNIQVKGLEKQENYADNINLMKSTYDAAEFTDRLYDRTAKYGEAFVYIVPYKKAMAKLLRNKSISTMQSTNLNCSEGTIITESGVEKMQLNGEITLETLKESGIKDIKLEFDQSSMIESIISNYNIVSEKRKVISESALNESLEDETTIGQHKLKKPLDKTVRDDLSFEYDGNSQDGLIIGNEKSSKSKKELKVPGCVVKILDRARVIPIYIEDLCLGYYYIEVFNKNPMEFDNKLISPAVYTTAANRNLQQQNKKEAQDNTIKFLAGQISQQIDANFINSNQDLRKEIYMILKYNDLYSNNVDSVRVSFIPPEDMVHSYFKKDEKTHRGLSDLHKGLIPAKLYCSLYITYVLGILTRGFDKRVYYVNQSVETNIAKSLLNVINQIKKSNFGVRQIDNLNNILNISGRYNDLIIPRSANGNTAIEFEVMPGQQIDPKQELLEILETAAVNSTDVPIEVVNSRQTADYAVQVVMTNGKFLRHVYNRQSRFNHILSEVFTKIYNAEFEDDQILEVILPPPMFLNITNTNQIVTNARDFANTIVEMEMIDEEDETVKNVFTKLMQEHYLSSYIDLNIVNELKIRAQHIAAVEKAPEEEEPEE